jgi:hypothetical protein
MDRKQTQSVGIQAITLTGYLDSERVSFYLLGHETP